MAEGAIFHLLSRIAPLIIDEFNLMNGVRQEIDLLRGEFEQMNSFLQVADANDEDNDPQLEVWVKQVRETAYDAGDIVEHFVFRLNHHHGFLRKVYMFITRSIFCHQIASEVQRIKLKVEAISQGYQRYAQYNFLKLQSRNGQASSLPAIPTSLWYDSRGDAILLRENEIVGITKPKLDLTKLLVDEESGGLRVVSVCGMGGLGKTTLVKKAFDDAEVIKHFESHAWITVSKSFQLKELLKEMIQKLLGEVKAQVPVEVERMEPTQLKEFISLFLQEKKYNIVLDDVWNIDTWNAFKCAFPDNKCDSRVIITTRDKSVASFASHESEGQVFNLLPLSENDSRTLFCRKVFQGNPCPPSLERITSEILKKCEGLPLAIVSIGGLLATKDQKDIDEWHRIYRSVGDELGEKGKLKNLFKILNLSYIDLPSYLKLCMMYFNIFPEDYTIDHWRLIRLWVAEGFAKSTPSLTAEEVAGNYLCELLSRSLILLTRLKVNGKAKEYHIHDIWHEFILSRSIKQGFVSTLGTRQSAVPCKVRRLSIHNDLSNWQEIKHHTTHVRSLLMFGSIDLNSTLSIVGSLRDGERLLKVLDVRNSPITTFPKQIGKLLHLTYLSLRGTGLEKVPKCIGNLQMLETLDLKYTKVTELPNEILELRRLRHLLVYRYLKSTYYFPLNSYSGFRVPRGIGKLTCLQKLCSIELNQSNCNNILFREIAKLTQLRRINILQLKSADEKDLCSALENLSELRTLFIGAIDKDEIINLGPLSSPPEFLQTLSLTAQIKKLPRWVPSLQHLTKLLLHYSKFTDDPLLQLQRMANLTYLELYDAYEGEVLTFGACGFKQLTLLALVSLNGLERVNIMENAMPRLKILQIADCPLMGHLPSGIESLSCLDKLFLFDMPDKLISKLNVDEQHEQAHRIAHIPKVWVGYVKPGLVKQGYYL